MELRQLQCFLVVAEAKSLLGASKKMYLSHQALSKAIQGLEQELKVTLFVRSRTGVELTSAGRELLPRASQIIAESDALIESFGTISRQRRKTFNFGITYGLLESFAMNLISEFERRHPEWELVFTEGTDKAIEQGVLDGKLDVGCISGMSANDALNCRLVAAKSKTLFATHCDNPLAQKDSIRLTDLSHQTFLAASSDCYSNQVLLDACKASGFDLNVGYQTSNRKIIVQLLEMNKGVLACVKETIPYFTKPSIVVRPIEDDPYIFGLYLVYHTKKARRQAVISFSEFFIELINNLYGCAPRED